VMNDKAKVEEDDVSGEVGVYVGEVFDGGVAVIAGCFQVLLLLRK